MRAKLKLPSGPAALAALVAFLGAGLWAARCPAPPGTPAVFLDEAAARPIIEAELKAAGLALAADAETIPSALQRRERVQRYVRDDDADRWVLEDTADPPTDLVLDGYDAARKIGYEYISLNQDYLEAGGDTSDSPWYSEDDLREAARYLRIRLAPRAGERRIGVFWAPVASYGYWGGPVSLAPEESLRGQVREFVARLKAEGVLE